MSDPIRRLYCHTKNFLKRSIKTVALLAFFIFFLGIKNINAASDPLPIEADRPSGNVEVYTSLFSPGTGSNEATFRLTNGFRDNDLTAKSLIFLFNGGFALKDGHDAAWYWNKVADFDNPNVFLMRVCEVDPNTKRPIETSTTCAFAPFPYAKYVQEGDKERPLNRSNYWRLSKSVATTIAQGESYLNSIRSSKIYHYREHDITVTSDGEVRYYNGDDADNVVQTENSKRIENHLFSVKRQESNWFALINDQLVSVPNQATIMSPGKRYQADLWYCVAANVNFYTGNELDKLITETDRVRKFGNLCGDDRPAYIRIAGTQFNAPKTLEELNAINTYDQQNLDSNTGNPNGDTLPGCGLIMDGSFMGCMAKLVYYLIFRPIAWVASLLGSLFDFFLGYSLSDESYRAEFVIQGWRIIRDFSNIFFIILMVYTGLAAVFGFNKIAMKKVVAALIVNAILINFSLFFTRVVIDITNITARIFYSRIYVCYGECKDDDPKDGKIDNLKRGIAGYWPISERIVSSFNPQLIVGPALLKNQSGGAAVGDYNLDHIQGSINNNESQMDQNSSEYAGYFIVATLIGSGIILAIAIMFWKVSFMFLGRVIGLYVAMIFAPFAVLTRGNVPLIGKISGFNWDEWWGDLVKTATLAPIFVFFLYVIYFFLQSDFMKVSGLTKGGSFIETVIYISIPMLIIYSLISYGATLAKNSAGRFGNLIQNKISGAVGGFGGLVGGGVGLASGLTGAIGRYTVGRGIKTLANRKNSRGETLAARLASRADKSSFARNATSFLKWGQTSSFDPRNLGFKAMGKNYNLTNTLGAGLGIASQGTEKLKDNISGKLKLGAEDGKGGYKKILEDRNKARKEKIRNKFDFSILSEDQVKAAWKKAREEKIASFANSGWAKNIQEKEMVENYYKNSEDFLKLKEKETEILKDLETTKAQKLYSAAAIHEEKLTKNRAAQSTYLSEKEDELKGLKTSDPTQYAAISDAVIDKIKKDGKITDSKAYKDLAEEEKKRLDKYGDVGDAKKLKAVMTAEYAQDLRNYSLWLKNGEKRFTAYGIGGTAGGTLAKTITDILGMGGLGLGVGLPAGVALVSYFDTLAEVEDQATKDLIKEGYGTPKKGSNLAKAIKNLSNSESRLIEIAKKIHGENVKINDLTDEQIDLVIGTKIVDIENEIDALKSRPDSGSTSVKAQIIAKQREKSRVENIYSEWQQKKKDVEDAAEKDRAAEEKKASRNSNEETKK